MIHEAHDHLTVGWDDVRVVSFSLYRGVHWPEKDILVYHLHVGDEKWGFVSQRPMVEGWTAHSFFLHGYGLDGAVKLTPEEQRAHRGKDAAYHRGETMKHSRTLESVGGFISRSAAAVYIIKTFGYWRDR